MSNVATVEKGAQELMLNPENPREREMILVEREFAMMQRKGQALAASSIIPKEFQQNLPNCLIAMEMAQRLNTGELEIMQNLYVIHGRPSFSASYLIAKVNNSNILKGRLKFEFVGKEGTDDYGCYAYGIDSDTEERLAGTVITVRMAKAQGWWGKNGSKWPDMTDQMLQYRSASFWSRVYAPDATMGMHTVEEVQEIEEKEINPIGHKDLQSVQSMLAGAREDLDAIDKESKAPATTKPREELVEVIPAEAKTEPAPEQAKYSKVFRDFIKLIDLANSTKDLEAIVSMDGWNLLEPGEAPALQAEIQKAKDSFTEPA